MTASTRSLLVRAIPRIPRLGAGALLSLLTIAAGVALLAVSGYLIQQASLRPPILSLDVAAVGVRLFSLLRATGRYFERLATHDAVLRLLADTRVEVYEAMEQRTPGAYDQERIGDLMRNVTADVDSLQDFYARGLLPPAVAAIALLVGAFAAGLATASIGVALFAVAVAGALAVVLGAALSARGAAGRLAALNGALAADITDALLGRADLAGAGALDLRIASIEARSRAVRREQERLAWSRAAAAGLVSLTSAATVLAVLIAGILAVAAGLIPAITVGIVAIGAMAVGEPVAMLPAAVDGFRSGRAANGRLAAVTTRPLPVADPPDPAPFPDSSRIELRDVTMRYVSGGRPALDGVSLVLEPGRSIGIRGPSGAGKSSLAAVLVRFRDHESGEYRIGGVDVHRLRGSDVRARVGLLAQDAHIFATSVRENIRLARPAATDEELTEAARQARLLQWIESLPQGWDTLVGERGAMISGGQRRRLALARALLADFPVLVVDEPTEALDSVTAREVMTDIRNATRDRALLVISHRAGDLIGLDSIYTMRGGVLLPDASVARRHDENGAGGDLRHAPPDAAEQQL